VQVGQRGAEAALSYFGGIVKAAQAKDFDVEEYRRRAT